MEKKKSNKEKGIFLAPHLAPDYKQEHTNRIVTLQRRNDIISLILDGKPPKEIRSYLVSKYKLTPGTANVFIQHARNEIKNRKELEVQELVSLHLHRYEEIYKEAKALRAATFCIDVLKAKENLLQFHREGFHMKVTKGQIQTVHLSNVNGEYDLERLSEEKKNRLEQLLTKAKG